MKRETHIVLLEFLCCCLTSSRRPKWVSPRRFAPWWDRSNCVVFLSACPHSRAIETYVTPYKQVTCAHKRQVGRRQVFFDDCESQSPSFANTRTEEPRCVKVGDGRPGSKRHCRTKDRPRDDCARRWGQTGITTRDKRTRVVPTRFEDWNKLLETWLGLKKRKKWKNSVEMWFEATLLNQRHTYLEMIVEINFCLFVLSGLIKYTAEYSSILSGLFVRNESWKYFRIMLLVEICSSIPCRKLKWKPERSSRFTIRQTRPDIR